MSRAAAYRMILVACAFGTVALPVHADAPTQRVHLETAAEAPNWIREGTPVCIDIAAPARRLETMSKYDQDVASRSLIDQAAAARRQNLIAPVSSSIAQLAGLSRQAMGEAPDAEAINCAARNLMAWARAGALTEMATSDANLTRDRFVVDISTVLATLKSRGQDLSANAEVRDWVAEIGGQIMRYYDWKAGPVSARNNHRYWAGLAVGHIGYFLGDASMVSWAKRSFEIGACQIDGEGFLPLELARAEKALEYHLYAYRALAGFYDLAHRNGDSVDGQCADRFSRLEGLLANGHQSTALFEARSGYRQEFPNRQNTAAALRATAMTRDRHDSAIYGGL